MRIVILMLFILSFNSFAACEYTLSPNKNQIIWTAFKTPKKVGVEGKFTKFKLKTVKSNSIVDSIKSANFTIDTTSVDTTNPARDQKIVTFFFTKKNKPLSLKGKVIEANEATTRVLLNFNGHKKEVVLNNTITDEKVVIAGSIDILDFGLNSNLQSINEACKVLHEGKTWSDVNIRIEAEYSKKCK